MSDNIKENMLPDEENVLMDDADVKIAEASKSEENKKEEPVALSMEEEEVKAYSPEKKADAPSDNIADTQIVATEKTMLFGKLDEEAAQETDAFSSTEKISHTRHFSLRGKSKRAGAERPRKNLMQNFRVLSKENEDRAILEAAHSGDGSVAFVDSVKAGKGEDLFEAVERAYNRKQEEERKSREDKKSERVRRNERAAAEGAELLKEIAAELEEKKKAMIAYGVLFALSLVLTLVFSAKGFYAVISLLLSAAACGLSIPVFEKSLRALKSFNAVADTAVAVMSFFVLIHNISVIILGQPGGVYTPCIIFACLMRVGSDYLKLISRQRLVTMALKNKGLSTLQRIAVKNDAVTFVKNTVTSSSPDIFYCTDAMLDTSLAEPETDTTRENKYFIFTMSLVLLAALVVGLFFFTTQMTGLSFVTALTAAVCVLLPVMYDPLSRFIFWRQGEKMLGHGACISGREALTHIGKSDGFVLQASDVFSGEVSRFRKSALTKMLQNDSAVFAALLIREAGSVLAPCFDSFLEEMDIVLPEVENFLYEERLGYSAWVLDRKVLVGNRQMLLNHSISVPTKEQEKSYAKGRYVMYVVIDGEITATFLVGYKVHSSLRRYSRDFNKTGLVLMLNSREAFLDEEAVAARLSIDASSVKILSSKAIAIMEKYNSRYDRQVPTGLLCAGKKRSLMHLIMGCYNANATDRFILIMMLLGQLLGFLMLVLSAILNMKLLFNPVAIVAFRLIWSAITAFVAEKKDNI